jgi:dihydrodipicolinate synthase/N-acetylneuraminate lyase
MALRPRATLRIEAARRRRTTREEDVRREDCSGIWVPLVTPFAAGGDLELGGIEALVDALLPHGIRGILTLGTTGEASHLSDSEADQVASAVVRAVRGRVPVLAGAGRPSTRQTVAAAQRMAAAGADAVLIMTPSVYRARMDGEALRRHYDTVAEAAPVPVFVYHIPEVTGLDLAPEILAAVLEHPNVWGFKDSSVTGGPLSATLAHRGGAGAMAWVGAAPRLVEGYAAGAAGALLAVANVVPAACVAFDAAWRRGDRTAAQTWQARIAAVTAAWHGGWAVSAIKHVLQSAGLPAGYPRQPLVDVPASVSAAVAAARAACLAGN